MNYTKKAGLYSIHVVWDSGEEDSFKIVGVNMREATTWFDYQLIEHIKEYHTKELCKEYALVENKFCSSYWTQELEDNQKRWKTIKKENEKCV